MAHVWPLFELVLRTPRLELRPVRETDMFDLTELAGRGIHDPDTMPFLTPFTDLPTVERERSSLRFYWGNWANWSVDDWTLAFVVRRDGECVGTQDLRGLRFPVRRTLSSGSWLGRAHQGQGLGTEMRAAVLELAFGALGAIRAETEAFAETVASRRVSEKLGYRPNGWSWERARDRRVRADRFALDVEDWNCPIDVSVDGVSSSCSTSSASIDRSRAVGRPIRSPNCTRSPPSLSWRLRQRSPCRDPPGCPRSTRAPPTAGSGPG